MLELITGRAAAVRGTLDELAREGARRMIEIALQLECCWGQLAFAPAPWS